MQNRDVYFVSRRPPRRKKPHRTATFIIAALAVLSAGICLLVVFLPKRGSSTAGSGYAGASFYFLVTGESDTRSEALIAASDATARGGAGYIYNDGKYRVIAAVYTRESDVKTLVAVNSGATYFSLTLPPVASPQAAAAIKYLTGEWFDTVSLAAVELDRGNTTEAAAEYAARKACAALRSRAERAGKLAPAMIAASDYTSPDGRSVLSYLRFIQVRGIIEAVNGL